MQIHTGSCITSERICAAPILASFSEKWGFFNDGINTSAEPYIKRIKQMMHHTFYITIT
jgi:hypothetical protein